MACKTGRSSEKSFSRNRISRETRPLGPIYDRKPDGKERKDLFMTARFDRRRVSRAMTIPQALPYVGYSEIIVVQRESGTTYYFRVLSRFSTYVLYHVRSFFDLPAPCTSNTIIVPRSIRVPDVSFRAVQVRRSLCLFNVRATFGSLPSPG